MQSVVRSTFFVGAIALIAATGLTACGDKVNVTNPPADSAIHSVTVTPPSLTMNVGDKSQLAASVDAGSGAKDLTVVWASANTAVATVDQNGNVTAVAGGNTTITATSHADASKKGAAAITVGAVVQASVSIGQINQTVCDAFGGCTSVPANLGNVANQLDVTLNVDPGTQKISEVDLVMNCAAGFPAASDTIVAKQVLSSGDVTPASAEDAASPVTLSFNTAAFNATTGVVSFKNGACQLKAKAITTSGTQAASNTQAITLNNIDGVIVATTNSGNSAADAKGSVWKSGSITVAATPVLFSGRTPATVSITLPGANTPTIVGTASTTGTTSATWSSTSSSAPNVKNLTLKAGVDGNGFAIAIHPVVLVVDSQGNDVNLVQLSPVSASDVRVDNQAPDIATVPPTINLNVQNATNGWVGANFAFTTSGSGHPITLDATTTADNGGVDVVKANTQWSPAGAGTFTTFTSVSGLTETSSSTAYDLRLQVCDALNNCANTAVLTQFGVDLTPPSLAQTGGVKDKQVFNIASGAPTAVSFSVIDTSKTSGVSGSGVSSTTGLLVTDQGLNPSGATSSKTTCPIGNATGSGSAITCASGIQEPISLTLPAAAKTDGEYTMVVSAIDQAGNASAPITIHYYVDLDVPTISGGVTIPASITAGATFSGLSAADSMDVAAGNGNIDYPGLFQFFETGSASPAGVTFDNALTRSSTISIALGTFYRSLSNTLGAAGPNPDFLNTRAIDAAGNLSASNAVALPAANIGTPAAISNTSATNGITAFSIDSLNHAAPDTAGKTITFSVNATAFSATSGNPLTQVCLFYQATAANASISGAAVGELVKIGCSSAAATTSNPAGTVRFFFYSIPWATTSAFAGTGPVNVYAVGNTANFDAIISAANAAVSFP